MTAYAPDHISDIIILLAAYYQIVDLTTSFFNKLAYCQITDLSQLLTKIIIK